MSATTERLQSEYTPTSRDLPPKNVPIEWISPGGVIVRGKYQGGAVWLPDGSPMYVYYTPAYWRRVLS